MEGLLIDQALRPLSLPANRKQWRFPDAYTYVLPLEDVHTSLWLYNKPPNPRLTLSESAYPAVGKTYSGFQDLLLARATGKLTHAKQHKLDRIVSFYFSADEGFVDIPPCILIAELTGRNCNLILTDTEGKVLGAAKEVTREVNRYRQVRTGLSYLPPPPYEKCDPRQASEQELQDILAGNKVKQLRSYVDGFGPILTKTVAVLAGVTPSKALTDTDTLSQVVTTIKDVVANPQAMMQKALNLPDLATLRQQEARAARIDSLTQALEKRITLYQKRYNDIDQTIAAEAEASIIRQQADVLMAFQYQVPAGVAEVTLQDFSGEPLTLQLEPTLNAVENAKKLYQQAKKRETKANQAINRLPEVEAELKKLETILVELATYPDKRLKILIDEYVKKPKAQYRATPGMRFESPQGYTVLVGRNAKDNDTLTSKIARSMDVWLHVQGYQGSHVIIQANNKPVPFEVILYAAALAAGHSKARQSDNVAVDYTLKKHVWKVKGAPAGAVNFTQHKTVYVTPQRH